jgi:hypothetical protein
MNESSRRGLIDKLSFSRFGAVDMDLQKSTDHKNAISRFRTNSKRNRFPLCCGNYLAKTS